MGQVCCNGLTKAGNPCRVTVGLVDGFCRAHRGQVSQGLNKPDSVVDESAAFPGSAVSTIGAVLGALAIGFFAGILVARVVGER